MEGSGPTTLLHSYASSNYTNVRQGQIAIKSHNFYAPNNYTSVRQGEVLNTSLNFYAPNNYTNVRQVKALTTSLSRVLTIFEDTFMAFLIIFRHFQTHNRPRELGND